MKISFPVTLTAADAEERIIAGRIVQWNAEGNTSAGRTMFAENSIKFGKNTKLVLQHDITRPIGKLIEWSQDETGVTASFKIAKTTAGNDALEEAATGLRSDFSVGVEVKAYDNKDGVLAITSSRLIEVSLVTDGAIPGAEVERVAAEESEVSEPEVQEDQKSTEEGEQVSDTTVPTTPAVEETVEAAKVEVKAATAPVITTKLRTPVVDNVSFLEHSIRASLGNDLSRQYVMAASDTDTTDVAGLVPTRQLSEVINGKTTAGRATIDAISSGTLPDAGMKFQIPRIKTAPTVAVVAEKGAFSDTQVEIEYVDVNVKKFAGMQKFDVEVLDRTSPAFFAELQMLMADAYAKATDSYVLTTLGNDGFQDTTAVTLPWDGDEFSGFISRAASTIYENTLRFATGVIVSPTQWANIIALNDTAKRPIFSAAAPQNAGGAVSPTSLRGSIMGLDLYVDYALTTDGDDSILVVNRDSYTWYESPRLQLRADTVGTGQVEVGYYGYGAVATKIAKGCFKFNKA